MRFAGGKETKLMKSALGKYNTLLQVKAWGDIQISPTWGILWQGVHVKNEIVKKVGCAAFRIFQESWVCRVSHFPRMCLEKSWPSVLYAFRSWKDAKWMKSVIGICSFVVRRCKIDAKCYRYMQFGGRKEKKTNERWYMCTNDSNLAPDPAYYG